tara:strand:+ start:71 stop:616 length:546 start_codon:yes stop_codon:yes gene_type:complete
MKLELIIFGITGFLIANTYHDGKYTEMLKIKTKYIRIAMFSLIGLSLYIFIKKHPGESSSLLTHATDLIKYMPIDKNTEDIISPLFKFTNMPSFGGNGIQTPQMKRMMNSGRTSKRSVSETKKKFIASRQSWKCKSCQTQLDAAFEVNHIIALENGGTNHIDNLEALCRNCHGQKTMLSHL